tara:strand:- start:3435 stop:4220 length:786 start_codon:yes stop_codon:yes gene_type:complete
MNYEKPFFSIITPFFNAKKYFDLYLQKLNNQTYSNWECILIDDYSDDNGFEKLKLLTSNDQRIHVYKNTFTKSIKSPYQARNFGISKAKGKYISFLDIDDYWLENMLMLKHQKLSNNPDIDILFSNYIKVSNTSKPKKVVPLSILPLKLQLKFHNPIGMLTSTIKKKVISNHKFKPINHEDYLFWAQLNKSNKNLKIEHMNEFLAVYNISNNSISANKLSSLKWHYLCYLKLGYKELLAVTLLFPLLLVKSISWLKSELRK